MSDEKVTPVTAVGTSPTTICRSADYRRGQAAEHERLRALLPKQAPTGHDSAVCSLCYSMVAVEPMSEWDDGDICDSCVSDAYDALRAAILGGEP